jgi:hypothetical protein
MKMRLRSGVVTVPKLYTLSGIIEQCMGFGHVFNLFLHAGDQVVNFEAVLSLRRRLRQRTWSYNASEV